MPVNASKPSRIRVIFDLQRRQALARSKASPAGRTSADNKSSASDTHTETMTQALPPWLKESPDIETDGSTISRSAEVQLETVQECLPLLLGEHDALVEVNQHNLPRLVRKKHVRFLRFFLGSLPTPFTALDASRPWNFYWCLMGMYLLGDDVAVHRKRSVVRIVPPIDLLMPRQPHCYSAPGAKRIGWFWWRVSPIFAPRYYLCICLVTRHCWGK